jgi:predicted dinucleotide-binding enzyme
MKIGLLGSGNVGQALAKGFLSEEHEVWMATHDPTSEKGTQLKAELKGVNICDFVTAAKEAELAVLCVKWVGAEEVVKLAGPQNLTGKVVIDTSNIIKTEGDSMVYGGDDKSAAQQVQAWLPDSQVVKAFNTVGAAIMYKPEFSQTPTMFIAGDDPDAKKQVADIAKAFGWEPLDTGGLASARELEAMALVWIRNSAATHEPHAFKML